LLIQNILCKNHLIVILISAILLISACGDGGGDSSPLATAPATPTEFSVLPGDQSISISWGTVTNTASYNVYWSTTSGTGTGGNRVAVSNPTFTHSSLINGATYYYVVTAVNSAGESAVSAEVSTTPVAAVIIPAAPTGLLASPGDQSVSIIWGTVTNAASYNVYWSTTSGTGTGGTQVAVSNPTFTHSPLTNDTTYYYVVTAVNSAGESAISTEVSTTPANTSFAGLSFADAKLGACVNASAAAIGATTIADLRYLSCFNRGISDITGIEALTSLRFLHLGTNSISDISPVSALVNLTTLVLYNNSVSDISALADLSNLTNLKAGQNSISDISSLSGLTGLTMLYLEYNNISVISAVSSLTSLNDLRLLGNNITSISAVSGLTSLTILYLLDNNISDISPLSGLTGMRILSLGGNNITDISALSGLTVLNSLTLSSNTISDISALSGLSLTAVNLYKNNISDASALSGKTNLVSVNLAFNNISDVSAFSGLINLTALDLRSNKIGGAGIGKVDTLTELTKANYIFLQGNNAISCTELTTLIDSLGSPPVDTDNNLSTNNIAIDGTNCTNP